MKIRIEFFENVLGTTPAKENLLRDYVASKGPDAQTLEEEVAALGVDAVTEGKTTVFPRTVSGEPLFWDYQIKGMFKDSCQMLVKAGKSGYPGGKACAALKAYKKAIDGLIFVSPRQIPIDMHGMKMDTCERPLRAQTPQGERVSIANSEAVPAGSTIEFEVTCLDDKLYDMVTECLDYGALRGMGQWRNSGAGRYHYAIVNDAGEVIGGNMP